MFVDLLESLKEFDWRIALILGATISLVAFSGSRCTAAEEQAKAAVGVACINSGGEWARGTFGPAFECTKKPEKH